MTHYFSSGAFYGGRAGWHGLGTVKDGYPLNAREAFRDGGLLFTPELQPLFTDDGLAAPARAVVRPDNHTVLGVVSETFRVHSHVDEFSRIVDGFDGAVRISAVTGLHDGATITLSAEIIGGAFQVVPGDDVQRFLNIWTGHTGRLATTVQLGSEIRIECQNCLTAAMGSDASFRESVKHSKHSQLSLDSMIQRLHALRTDDSSPELLRAMARTAVDDLGFSRFVAATYETDPVKVQELPAWERLERLWHGGAIGASLAGATAWGAFNTITEFATHHMGRSKDPERAAVARMESTFNGPGAVLIGRAREQARILTLA
jgi:phage/plasmid-like protein (TIGR03299 family)